MSNRIFKGLPDSLRSPERIALLEVERVVELCLEGIYVTKVLDVGTGSGVFAEAFGLRNLETVGVDSNPDMVKLASKLVTNAKFKEGTAETLPFRDRSFDLVFLGTVLHESDDPLLALKEAGRVAASRVAILEWPYVKEVNGPPIDHRLQPERIRELAKQAGFIKIDTIELSHMVLYRMAIPDRAESDEDDQW